MEYSSDRYSSTNGLAMALRSTSFIFADDVKVIGTFGSNALGKDILQVRNWAKTWDPPAKDGQNHLFSGNPEDDNFVQEDGRFVINVASKAKNVGTHLH